jgi:hypothetical protein
MPRKSFPLTRDELYRLYHEEYRSIGYIAELTQHTERTVMYWMEKGGIETRSKGEGVRLAIERGERKRKPVNAKLKSELTCRNCGASWKYSGGSIKAACPYCGEFADARDRKEEAKRYAENHPERMERLKALKSDKKVEQAMGAEARALLRKRVFFRICGSISPSCVRCGCDDPRLLEINHKEGGGTRETQKGKYSQRFYFDIARGKRSTDDLELLCKPCNAIHALEMRFGPLPMKVVWLGTLSEPPD